MVARLLMRLVPSQPAPAKSKMTWVDRVALPTDCALYLLMFVMLARGMTMAAGTRLLHIALNGKGSLPKDFWHLPESVV
ncbi:hypothetical protein, partial [Escherichia coli]|uniref:hypothetical protein n=1 Tax=Escherichia coli TaxID=562 RepID=UPI003754C565